MILNDLQYSYEEVIGRIENSRRFGKHTGYEVSRHILEKLGHPEKGLPFVHVAGTNGKGSTTAFLCKILEQTGMKVGMFTSPHLVEFGERIRINGIQISKENITRIGNLLLDTEFELPPTMFDYCMAMAVLYFKEQDCDIVVMETGIGGRYDSTNALGIPEVAVITKIGLDHIAILGNTLEEIAGEKAGIIKEGCPVVTAPQQESVINVLLDNFNRVNHTHAAFYEVSEDDLTYVKGIPIRMLGGFQIENAATAVLAAKLLFRKWSRCEFPSDGNLPTSDRESSYGKVIQESFQEDRQEQYIRAGLANTFWKGRMELINEHPFFMIDGAHNAHGVHALAESLQHLYPGEKFHFIMAVMADKDYEDMINELLPLALDFVTVTPESNRALQSKDLAECIARKGVKATYVEDMESVIKPLLPLGENTQSQAVNGDAVSTEKTIAFGSLYFIGAIEALLKK